MIFFPQKIGLDILCKFLPKRQFASNFKAYFLGKKCRMSSAEMFTHHVSVKGIFGNSIHQISHKGLIVLRFNDMSTLVGHFVSSPRAREKRDRRDSRRD